MTDLQPPPRFPSKAVRDTIRALLADAGYVEPALARAFGPDVMDLPRYRGSFELARRAGGHSPQDLLVRLFLGGLTASREEALDLLGAPAVAALRLAGLLVEDGTACAALAGLAPVEAKLFAHDRRDAHKAGAADFVVGPGPATRRFAELAIRRTVASSLDLGCGQGALGVLAATHSKRVTSIDLNPRAVAFCAFNAELNGVDNVESLSGDLYAPVSGQKFELILSNPPYVISPASTFLYRDGGGGICERIARAAPTYLEPGGTLQMTCNWPHYRGRDWQADLARWFEGSGCDAWVLTTDRLDAASYAGVWLRQQHDETAALGIEFEQWMEFYERQGIEALGGGLVLMRKTSGRTPWFEVRAMPQAHGLCGESIARTLDGRDFLARTPRDASLLDARLCLSPDAVATITQRSGGDGWTTNSTELRLARGLAFGVRVDAVSVQLAGYLDGKRTVREAAAAYSAASSTSLEPLLPQLPRLVRQLTELGLLLPTIAPEPATRGDIPRENA
jgi:SAM-dependent methyltransferase